MEDYLPRDSLEIVEQQIDEMYRPKSSVEKLLLLVKRIRW